MIPCLVGTKNPFTIMNIHVFIYMCSVSGPVAFSQSVYTVHESQARINISIFSYIFVAPFDDLMVNFTTFDENATEGTCTGVIQCYLLVIILYTSTCVA